MWRQLTLFGYKITAKVFDSDSGLGYGVFHAGRISYLRIVRHGKELFLWDRHMVADHLSSGVVQTIVKTIENLF